MPKGTPAVAPADYDEADVGALQALQKGEASEFQQKRSLDWILLKACALQEWAYRTDERSTSVALGRQFVAQQIVKLLKTDPSKMRRTRNG